MTDQERQLLEELAGRVQKAPPSQVDHDADELIRRSIGSRPDALYILTQTVLIQEMALNQAKQQIDQLKSQQPPASFLGSTGQAAPSNPPPAGAGFGQGNRAAPPSGYRASTYQSGYVAPPPPAPPPVPQYAQPQYSQPQYVEQPRSGFSSFLHNAAQTAAGVVAGEVAFSAISSLFGGGRGGGYYGGGGGFLGGGGGNIISPVSETIINNNTYIEEGDRGGDRGGYDREDRSDRDDDRRLADSSSDDTPADDYVADDSTDNSSDTDDSSSYDDGSDSSDV